MFDHLISALPWRQRTVTMWERRLPEPRLTSWWTPEQGPEAMPILATMRRVLSTRYAEAFDSIGFNCYRHGDDSVAWHGDRHRHTDRRPRRRHRQRRRARGRCASGPRGGGQARSFDLGRGDLFVMGGACQHDWEHAVPKVRAAEPRISITYRHGAR